MNASKLGIYPLAGTRREFQEAQETILRAIRKSDVVTEAGSEIRNEIRPARRIFSMSLVCNGRATVYDADSGLRSRSISSLPPGVPSINDVGVTRLAALFTDTSRPFLRPSSIWTTGQPGDTELIPLPPT